LPTSPAAAVSVVVFIYMLQTSVIMQLFFVTVPLLKLRINNITFNKTRYNFPKTFYISPTIAR